MNNLKPNITIIRPRQQQIAKDLRELAAALEADGSGASCAVAVWMKPGDGDTAFLCRGFKDDDDAARRLATVFDGALGFAR